MINIFYVQLEMLFRAPVIAIPVGKIAEKRI